MYLRGSAICMLPSTTCLGIGDFSDSNTIVVVGLPPGQHKVLIELADPEHRIFTGQTVTFTVPASAK